MNDDEEMGEPTLIQEKIEEEKEDDEERVAVVVVVVLVSHRENWRSTVAATELHRFCVKLEKM